VIPFWIYDTSATLSTGFGFSIGRLPNKKVVCLALCALLLALSFSAEAQQPAKIARIGYLGSGSASSSAAYLLAFREKLRDLGYTEARQIGIEGRYSEGKTERLPQLAGDLVRLPVDVIVTGGNEAVQAAKKTTQSVPIVMAFSGDPVGLGVVSSLAQPGGNVTGLTNLAAELTAKRLELLKEIVPNLTKVAVFWNPEDPISPIGLKEVEVAANALRLTVQLLKVERSADLEAAFKVANKEHAGGLILIPGAVTGSNQARIVHMVTKNRLPAVYQRDDYVKDGGLMSYGPDRLEQFCRAAIYVDKILKGTKPADLPVEQPTKFELVINLKTAKQIGLTIPQSVLARADKVIK
jgi:putative tryptophan/tyrosine transport system substrate-binding protein